jgi:hypothetical protein
MNERFIKELAEQTTEEMDQEAFSEGVNIPAEWYQKFAELIVRECIGIDFRHKIGLSSDDDYEVSRVIKQHFGVER